RAGGAERGGRRERGAAGQGVQPAGERAADVAAVPAGVDDAAEEDAERNEPEPPELGMLERARTTARRSPLLHTARCFRAQLPLALLARHGPSFAGAERIPTPRSRRPCRSTSAPRKRGARRGPRSLPAGRAAARASRPSPARRVPPTAGSRAAGVRE